MRPDDAHGTDPVRRYLGHQGVEDLQAGGVHHKDLWVMSVAQQAAFTLRADGEMIELVERDRRKQWKKEGGKGLSRDVEVQVWACISLKYNNVNTFDVHQLLPFRTVITTTVHLCESVRVCACMSKGKQ